MHDVAVAIRVVSMFKKLGLLGRSRTAVETFRHYEGRTTDQPI